MHRLLQSTEPNQKYTVCGEYRTDQQTDRGQNLESLKVKCSMLI